MSVKIADGKKDAGLYSNHCRPEGSTIPETSAKNGCCPQDSPQVSCSSGNTAEQGEPCCGPPPSAPSSIHEKPGYAICRYVSGFLNTPVGFVPRVSTSLDLSDHLGTLYARSGFFRNDYKVAPGLYAAGTPDQNSPVLVTANYKLTFDTIRTRLKRSNVWLLVIDTRGINVWCAGGKSLFSAKEVVRLVRQTGLARIISHRKLILPQLAANGVSAQSVRKACGFEVVWGPIRAEDIEPFIENNLKAAPKMRQVTFDTLDRLTLIPVELNFAWKPSLLAILTVFLLSGIGPDIFSLTDAVSRGSMLIAAFFTGVCTGAILTPALLPWLPFRMFSLKGLIAGLAGLIPLIFFFREKAAGIEIFALLFMGLAVSSYLAMNFTGSTPFTSPSGVEKEMKKSIPIQGIAIAAGIIFWVAAAFVG